MNTLRHRAAREPSRLWKPVRHEEPAFGLFFRKNLIIGEKIGENYVLLGFGNRILFNLRAEMQGLFGDT
jgi:hypothetical protein